jgi:uncharacterized protein (DUF608 family)
MCKGYKEKQLYDSGAQRAFSGETAREVAFPLGGIGAGCVSLSGTGELIDWEIFNRPNKGSYLPKTFFLLWAKPEGGEATTRILQGRPLPSFTGTTNADHGRYGDGLAGSRGIGLPHFAECVFRGEYPFADLDLADPSTPIKVSLRAYNPFIPLNGNDSSIPTAIFRFTLQNTGEQTVEVSLAASLLNAVGYEGRGEIGDHVQGGTLNTLRQDGGLTAISMTAPGFAADDFRHGSMALATSWPDTSAQTCWLRSGWFDSLQRYWDEFSASGTLQQRAYAEPAADGMRDAGALCLKATLAPGESATLPVLIAWHFPNYQKHWIKHAPCCEGKQPQWRNYYASFFEDAYAVARYVAWNEQQLYADTKLFHDALFDSTLPWYVLDAASSQASILKTTTCIRLEDGTFYGFEGCCLERGCCEGSCTHVWNYAQALPFLFPKLERSMRAADYAYNLRDDGKMCFRIGLPLGTSGWGFHAAADGQMGGIIKTYRDWKLCGDDEWLRALWPSVKKALEYAWQEWDADKDGVMEGFQHNTYDIEFLGPNSMMGAFYLGALRAAEEMARHLGEADKAAEYRAVYESGRQKLEETLYNGEYYEQKYDPEKAPKYQYGAGCLSDQLIGQWMARLVGLGDLLDPKHIRRALAAIFKHNWLADFGEHANCQRIYALNDEKGLLLCTWPRGGRPPFPFPYSDEVWCGIEYQVASHMIYEGLLEEGLSIVRGVRERHDGYRRNPWNEFECGSHYSRSMASWALLTALSGFSFDAAAQQIGFAPRYQPEKFASFWSVGSGWGRYRQKIGKKGGKATLRVEYGALALKTLALGLDGDEARVQLNGKRVAAAWAEGKLSLAQPLKLKAGDELTVRLR